MENEKPKGSYVSEKLYKINIDRFVFNKYRCIFGFNQRNKNLSVRFIAFLKFIPR